MDAVTFATRVCKAMNVESMIGRASQLSSPVPEKLTIRLVTNAAGGLNPSYAVGDIVVLNDVGRPPSSPATGRARDVQQLKAA